MRRSPLGATGATVSRLCLGTLTMGALQRAFTPREGAYLLKYAHERGVDFADTAQCYGSYAHIKEARRHINLTVATKSYAYTAGDAEAAVDEALRGMGTDVIDIMLLHEQESEHTLRGHMDALEHYMKRKAAGDIRLVGLSTHTVAGALAAVRCKLDVLHPLVNRAGIGIAQGTLAEMEDAVSSAHAAGMFVYTMKPLGGGHLIRERHAALEYAFGLTGVSAVALGVQSAEEIDYALAVEAGEHPDESLAAHQRALFIQDWCRGCGACAARCGQRALSVEDGRARVDAGRCVLCGYCAGACPDFAIKVL